MRLAVLTERVDLDADITGFTHRWWERLAARVEHLHVIAQGTGRAALPPNVTLHDVGKDRGASPARRAARVLATIHGLCRGTQPIQAVLAHMAPQYAILAWPAAVIHRVPVLLWFTHGSVDLRLRVAHALAARVLTASRLSFRIPSRKVVVLGHGIDCEKFSPRHPADPGSRPRGGAGGAVAGEGIVSGEDGGAVATGSGGLRLLAIGRLSPRKHLETVLDALALLVRESRGAPRGAPPIHLTIAGAPGTAEQESYARRLRERCQREDLAGHVTFTGSIAYDGIERIHRGADVFVSASGTGSVDKVVLEAMASGRPVVTSNEAFGEVLGPLAPRCMVPAGDPAALARRIGEMRDLSPAERASLGQELREIVRRDHDLERLMDRIVAVAGECR